MKFLFSESLNCRLIIFLICVGLVFAFCAFHGYYDGLRTGRIMDEMAEQGHFIGRFWRTVGRGEHKIVLAKFNRILVLSISAPEDLRPGDHVSFIARKTGRGNPHQEVWEAVENHVHGTSAARFLISAVAVFIVSFTLLRHLRADTKSRSLAFREEEKPCQMD